MGGFEEEREVVTVRPDKGAADRELVQVERHIEDTSQLQLNKTVFSSGASVHRYFLFTEVAAVKIRQFMQAARRSESRSAVSLVINPESSQSQHRNIRTHNNYNQSKHHHQT